MTAAPLKGSTRYDSGTSEKHRLIGFCFSPKCMIWLRQVRSASSGGRLQRRVEPDTIRFCCTLLLGALAGMFAWGYHQRQQARTWRERACAYRFADVARRATFLGDDAGSACSRLRSLGFEVRVSSLPVVPGGNDLGRP
jgi:hypothetical protein